MVYYGKVTSCIWHDKAVNPAEHKHYWKVYRNYCSIEAANYHGVRVPSHKLACYCIPSAEVGALSLDNDVRLGFEFFASL